MLTAVRLRLTPHPKVFSEQASSSEEEYKPSNRDDVRRGKVKQSSSSKEDIKGSSLKHAFLLSPDPESYLFAKKKLKKAVLEHYR